MLFYETCPHCAGSGRSRLADFTSSGTYWNCPICCGKGRGRVLPLRWAVASGTLVLVLAILVQGRLQGYFPDAISLFRSLAAGCAVFLLVYSVAWRKWRRRWSSEIALAAQVRQSYGDRRRSLIEQIASAPMCCWSVPNLLMEFLLGLECDETVACLPRMRDASYGKDILKNIAAMIDGEPKAFWAGLTLIGKIYGDQAWRNVLSQQSKQRQAELNEWRDAECKRVSEEFERFRTKMHGRATAVDPKPLGLRGGTCAHAPAAAMSSMTGAEVGLKEILFERTALAVAELVTDLPPALSKITRAHTPMAAH